MENIHWKRFVEWTSVSTSIEVENIRSDAKASKIDKILYWLRRFEPIGVLIGILGLIASISAFLVEQNNHTRRIEENTRQQEATARIVAEESEARAWQLLLTRGPGEGGRTQALESLVRTSREELGRVFVGLNLSCEFHNGFDAKSKTCLNPVVLKALDLGGGKKNGKIIKFEKFDFSHLQINCADGELTKHKKCFRFDRIQFSSGNMNGIVMNDAFGKQLYIFGVSAVKSSFDRIIVKYARFGDADLSFSQFLFDSGSLEKDFLDGTAAHYGIPKDEMADIANNRRIEIATANISGMTIADVGDASYKQVSIEFGNDVWFWDDQPPKFGQIPIKGGPLHSCPSNARRDFEPKFRGSRPDSCKLTPIGSL